MALRFSLIGIILFAGFCKPKPPLSPALPPSLGEGSQSFPPQTWGGLGRGAGHKYLTENNGIVRVLWQNQQVHSFTFGRDYETKEVKFAPPQNIAGELKLVRESKGASHIDLLTINGALARPKAAPANWFFKTTAADADVIDFPETLSFAIASVPEIRLVLRARIEPEVISKLPFRHPLVNQAQEFSTSSTFLDYAWQDRITCSYPKKPFLTEFAQSGSGHVDINTTFWVSNDRDSLCVKADFSSDNTMDGEKDYGEVVTRIGNAVRRFRILENHERWGKVHFTYNEMAKHEHKVYEFRIPKSELSSTMRIPLAFALYGTSTPSDMGVTNPVNFGTVLKGQSAVQTVTVTQVTAPLSNLQIIDVATPFSVENDNCTNAAPTFPCTFDVRFSPNATGNLETPIRVQAQGLGSGGGSDTRLLFKNIVLNATVTAETQGIIAPQLVSPAAESANIKNGSLLIWKKGSDASGAPVTHAVSVCSDANFTNCTPVTVACLPSSDLEILWAFLPLFLIVGHRLRRNLFLILIAAFTFFTCSTERYDMSAESAYNVKDYGRYQLSNVTANTLYYWKVTAINSTNGELSSTASTFTTGTE
jgi:hypothetical protein